MPDHTPTPWDWVDSFGCDPHLASCDNGKDLSDGYTVVLHADWDEDRAPKKVDRQFIKRAVNSHDELVSACEESLAEFRRVSEIDRKRHGIGRVERGIVIRQLEDALAKAKGLTNAR